MCERHVTAVTLSIAIWTTINQDQADHYSPMNSALQWHKNVMNQSTSIENQGMAPMFSLHFWLPLGQLFVYIFEKTSCLFTFLKNTVVFEVSRLLKKL